MSLALAPLPGHEMDDSIMQDDHPTDVAINIDMESPKHHAVTPQQMVFADASAPQGFWIQASATGAHDQLVDVEFETEGVAFEEDGMMSAAEVEMTTAPAYVEEYEYEMTYETGQPESNYEIEDTVVHDAEVLDAAPGHEPHVDSTFTAFAPEAVAQSHEVPETTVADAEAPPTEIPLPEESEAIPHPAEAAENAYATDHATTTEEVHATEEAKDTAHPVPEEEANPLIAIGTSTVETVEPDTATVHVSNVSEDNHERVEPEASTETTLVTVVLETKSQHESTPLPEAKEEEPGVTDAAYPVEEPSTVVDASTTYEEPEVENRNSGRVPPVILTAVSRSSAVSKVFALFDTPDVAFIASSSRQSDEAPVLLLEQHPYLFLEPITVFLTQLRTELLQAQPHAIPPAEFEYKELQLVVRDLQLILTEDNIYSREITLFDLKSMHESCGLPGYLHLDISLQPRFIDRYRAIRQAIDAHQNTDTSNVNAASIQHGTKDEEDAKANSVQNERAALDAHNEPEPENDVGGEEPPLPPDDEAASSWSEDQDEPQDEVPLAREELNEWEEAYNPEDTEGVALVDDEQVVQGEEFVHEDEYVPDDEPGVVVLEHDQIENSNGNDAKEHTTEDPEYIVEKSEEEDELAGFDEEAYDEEAQAQEAENQTQIADHNSEGVAQEAEDNVGGDPEYDENEGWDEQDYEEVQEIDDPEATVNEQPEITAPVLTEDSDDTDDAATTEIDNTNGLKSDISNEGTAPKRKRSFNEVEAEPEDDLSLSPNSKKPRHI